MTEDANATQGSRATANKKRALRWSLDRLSLKLGAGIALLVILPFGLVVYTLSNHHFEQTIGVHRRSGQLQARILEAALRHQMMDEDKTLMASILQEVSTESSVRRAMILNHEGEVRFASDASLLGRRFGQDSPSCLVCHSQEAATRQRWTLLEEDGEEILRSVLPIENRRDCKACHGKEERLNGILILDTSLADLREELRSDARSFMIGAGLMVFLIISCVSLFVRQLVLVRLGRLGSTVRSIAAGNLQDRVEESGRDVITSLARDFNSMAGTVSALVSEIRAQEEQLVSIMNSLDDGLVVLDSEFSIVAANRAFRERVNDYPGGVRGTRCHDMGGTLPCCNSGTTCPAELCKSTGLPQRAVFQTAAAGEERVRVEEVHASPVHDAQGKLVQVVEIWRDITERVEEEQRLVEIEHLVSLGTLASGFSHEVNTPLASMLTCAESAIAQIDERAAQGRPEFEVLASVRDCAMIIRDQILRCRKITEQFLRFSRGIPPSPEPVDLHELAVGVISLVQGTACESNVRVVLLDGGELPPVRANVEVVQHVLLNLLVNAIQSHEGRGGTIRLSMEAGEHVRVLISDDGCGIDAKLQEQLFEPFHSNKPGGTGLGLFLSRSFMRRFGGDVRLVRSEVGKGSTFELSFARELEVVS